MAASRDWKTPSTSRAFSVDWRGHDPARVLHSSGAMRRLLIVDDEEPILFAMREYFESVGFEVDCAARLDEAEALLATRHPQALIADLRLTTAGRSEGLALVAHARENSPLTRIVLLTAYGSPGIEREGMR